MKTSATIRRASQQSSMDLVADAIEALPDTRYRPRAGITVRVLTFERVMQLARRFYGGEGQGEPTMMVLQGALVTYDKAFGTFLVRRSDGQPLLMTAAHVLVLDLDPGGPLPVSKTWAAHRFELVPEPGAAA